MDTRIYNLLEKYNCLYKTQFGFRNSLCGVFLDFQKSFNTVNHKILLKKLHYGIRGITNDWFKSYLNNRTQQTKVNDSIS